MLHGLARHILACHDLLGHLLADHGPVHQVCDLGPDMGIAFAFEVGVHEGLAEPRCAGAGHRICFVVETVVAEDFCFLRIGSADLMASVDEAVGLIEVHRRRDIGGDDAIFLPELGDAVDLNGEQHGNSGTLQLARQHDYGGGSPTVAEENDSCL